MEEFTDVQYYFPSSPYQQQRVFNIRLSFSRLFGGHAYASVPFAYLQR